MSPPIMRAAGMLRQPVSDSPAQQNRMKRRAFVQGMTATASAAVIGRRRLDAALAA